MKQFLIFWGDDYYPVGGMGDLQADADTMEEALTMLAKYRWEWAQIFDTTRMRTKALQRERHLSVTEPRDQGPWRVIEDWTDVVLYSNEED